MNGNIGRKKKNSKHEHYGGKVESGEKKKEGSIPGNTTDAYPKKGVGKRPLKNGGEKKMEGRKGEPRLKNRRVGSIKK